MKPVSINKQKNHGTLHIQPNNQPNNVQSRKQVMARGRHLKRYSVIVIMLRYDFALSHNALLQSRTVIASNIVIALYIKDPLSLLIVIALTL